MLWGVVLSCEHNALGVRVACVIQITLDIRANDFPDAVTERLQSKHIIIKAGCKTRSQSIQAVQVQTTT